MKKLVNIIILICLLCGCSASNTPNEKTIKEDENKSVEIFEEQTEEDKYKTLSVCVEKVEEFKAERRHYLYRYFYTYDSHGNMIEEKQEWETIENDYQNSWDPSKPGDKGVNYSSFEYQYDDSGNILRKMGSNELIEVLNFEYDDNNNIIKMYTNDDQSYYVDVEYDEGLIVAAYEHFEDNVVSDITFNYSDNKLISFERNWYIENFWKVRPTRVSLMYVLKSYTEFPNPLRLNNFFDDVVNTDIYDILYDGPSGNGEYSLRSELEYFDDMIVINQREFDNSLDNSFSWTYLISEGLPNYLTQDKSPRYEIKKDAEGRIIEIKDGNERNLFEYNSDDQIIKYSDIRDEEYYSQYIKEYIYGDIQVVE